MTFARMIPINLNEILIQSCYTALLMQRNDGAMPAGKNGPHNHKMTHARNTAHWAIGFAHAYQLTKDSRFCHAALNACAFLISKASRPMGGAFWKRLESGKNSFNGLIGQSWCIEALLFCGDAFEDEHLIDVAEKVFEKHLFDWELGLWYQLGLNGAAVEIESTLNQQIWLAAMGSIISQWSKNAKTKVLQFLDRLPSNISENKNGLFARGITKKDNRVLNTARIFYRFLKTNNAFYREVEYGYHIFALCGLGMIKERVRIHPVWEKAKINKALQFITTSKFTSMIENSRFGYPYNVPGFEYPYVISIFGLNERADLVAKHACKKQIKDHLNWETMLLNRNTSDPETLAARVYEIYRIPKDKRLLY